jgi:hypothetical protein
MISQRGIAAAMALGPRAVEKALGVQSIQIVKPV